MRAARRRSPRDLAIRALSELNGEVERFRALRRARVFDADALLRATASASIDELWERLAALPFLADTRRIDSLDLERVCPGDTAKVMASAADTLERQVDLLGSGPVMLGHDIDWQRDFKTGIRWRHGYGRRIEYTQLGKPSDVKVPWELSRLHWAIPAGQAYLLTGEDRYARAVRDLLTEWIAANPFAWSVNWAVTMEVALRILTWTWLFHVFKSATAWQAPAFRATFLVSLFLHCEYVERNLERAEVNGNHYTADAAGLAVGGLFFGDVPDGVRWADAGWTILRNELPRQVTSDGVDFEASTAYHRLVTELFLIPALYRRRLGRDVDAAYRDRLAAMARFATAYCRPDGTSPLVGDADDGRALPLGTQALGDHRYLAGLVAAAFASDDLRRSFSGPRSEIAWLLGLAAASELPADGAMVPSSSFPDGGYYVMRGPRDHVFIDCGPVGFGGRGGHGHNDCLSFEAWLDGVLVVGDSGAYVYTADYRARNRFRATAAHNTPMVDDEEQNRFVSPEYLWLLTNDARPLPDRWTSNGATHSFRGGHTGYQRLADPVTPRRTIVLDSEQHHLAVLDAFEGIGEHRVSVPFHFGPAATLGAPERGRVDLDVAGRRFTIRADMDGWDMTVGRSEWSPSYGVARQRPVLTFTSRGPLRSLLVSIAPSDTPGQLGRARELIEQVE